MRAGSVTRARATATRCCWPPESWSGRFFRRSPNPNRVSHRPDQLSAGQQQRVAIARALITDPALILADEPTGNLDSRASDEIAGLLRQVSEEWGRSVVMVTHDPRIAAYADRIVFLKDGRIVDETKLNGNGAAQAKSVQEKVDAL